MLDRLVDHHVPVAAPGEFTTRPRMSWLTQSRRSAGASTTVSMMSSRATSHSDAPSSAASVPR